MVNDPESYKSPLESPNFKSDANDFADESEEAVDANYACKSDEELQTTLPPQRKRQRVKIPLTSTQRKAHNRIEKKYRINLNSKIASLQKLVPGLSQENVAFETNNSLNSQENNNEKFGKKLNKSIILDKVIEYLISAREDLKAKDAGIALLKSQLDRERDPV